MPLPFITLQQHLPFTVLKRYARDISVRINEQLQQHLSSTVLKQEIEVFTACHIRMQQHLLFTVCATECAAVEEQSDDVVRTSLT